MLVSTAKGEGDWARAGDDNIKNADAATHASARRALRFSKFTSRSFTWLPIAVQTLNSSFRTVPSYYHAS